MNRWQIFLAKLVYSYDKSAPALWYPPYKQDWIVGTSQPHGSKPLVQLALRVVKGDLSHLQYHEFGVDRESHGHTGMIGFVEDSITGSLRRDNCVGSLLIEYPLPIAAANRGTPLEAKAAASKYKSGHVVADLEQAAEFEQQQSDSDEDEEQGGGITNGTCHHSDLSRSVRAH